MNDQNGVLLGNKDDIFARLFEPSYFHAIGHTGGAYSRGKTSSLTTTEFFLAAKRLKAGKAADYENMLQALNRGLLWLTYVCQVALRSRRAPRDGKSK